MKACHPKRREEKRERECMGESRRESGRAWDRGREGDRGRGREAERQRGREDPDAASGTLHTAGAQKREEEGRGWMGPMPGMTTYTVALSSWAQRGALLRGTRTAGQGGKT